MKQPWLAQVEPGSISQTHVQCVFLPTISFWKTGTKSTCESCEWTWVVAGALAAPMRHKGEGQLLPLHQTHTHTHTHNTSWWLRLPRGCCALPSLCVSPGQGTTSLCIASSDLLRGRTGLCVCQVPRPGVEGPPTCNICQRKAWDADVGIVGPWRLLGGDGRSVGP